MRSWFIAVLAVFAVAVLLTYRWRRPGSMPPPKNEAVESLAPQPADSPRPQGISSPQPSPVQPKGDFPEVAAAELAQMRAGLTLREFTQSHPDEQPLSHSKSGDPEGRFGDYCALARANIGLNSGTTLERVAVFFLPPIPAPVTPPTAKDPAEMIGDCILGAIYLRAPAPDPNEADKIATALITTLSNRFGDPQRPPMDPYFNPGWHNRTQWKQGDTTVHAGYDPYRIGANDVASFRVYAYCVPVLELERKLPQWWQQEIALRPKETVNFEFAVKTAALDPAATAAIRGVYSRASVIAARATVADKAVAANQYSLSANEAVTVLRQWLKGVDGLSAQRRAAAFLAAYYLVRTSEIALQQDPQITRLFERVGSSYWKRTAYQDDDSRERWVGLAFNLDPDGPVGDTIVLEQMTQGCYFDGFYGVTVPLFEHVIAHGESYLRRTHDPADSALAEFLLASAYEDFVEVALGRLEDVDPAPFKSRLSEAREKAVQHYAAAIKFDPNSMAARIAWRESWKLLANLPSRNFHYYCGSGD